MNPSHLLQDATESMAEGEKKSRPVPQRTIYTNEARHSRLDHLEKSGANLSELREMRLDPATLRGNIESLIGAIEIPVGAAGPLRVNGANVEGEVFAPIATSEGALVSSINRGCFALQLSGGVTARTLKQRMVRAPVFDCGSVTKCLELRDWMQQRTGEIQLKVRQFSNHAVLLQLEFRVIAPCLHVRFVYETGDASGQNMTTVCTWNVSQWVLKEFEKSHPGVVRHFLIEGNLSADKKSSALSAIEGRGHEVVAEALLPDSVIRRVLHSTADDMARFLTQGQVTGVLTGIKGMNINAANVIAAIYAATGQDIACVHESSTAQLYFERRPEGLYASIFLPNLVIGTVGGGVGLAMQKQLLEMMGCHGPKKANRLAEVIASFVLALELSTGAAIAGGQFATAHERLGRNRSTNWLGKEDLTPTFFNHLLASTIFEPITEVNPIAAESTGSSLIMDLTSHISRRPCGLWAFDVRGENAASTEKVFLKTKVSDNELLLAFEIMAGVSSPGLGELLRENRADNPFNQFHVRELKIAEMTDAPLLDLMPLTRGTMINEKRDIYILAQEFLQDLEMSGAVEQRDRWTKPYLTVAIEQISRVHGHFLNKTTDLESKEWMHSWDHQRIQRLQEAHFELARHLQGNSYDWFTDDDVEFHREQLRRLPTLWLELERMPRTLIHNDFNPRNLAFRSKNNNLRLVAYDWELATVHIPQRDVAELLAFTLPEDSTDTDVNAWIDFHRKQVEKHSGVSLNEREWRRGYEIALLDILLQRFPIYGIAQSFRRLHFLEPAYRSARRILSMIAQGV